MKRCLRIGAGLLLMVSMVGCCYRPGSCDPATGCYQPGCWGPCSGGPLDPFCLWGTCGYRACGAGYHGGCRTSNCCGGIGCGTCCGNGYGGGGYGYGAGGYGSGVVTSPAYAGGYGQGTGAMSANCPPNAGVNAITLPPAARSVEQQAPPPTPVVTEGEAAAVYQPATAVPTTSPVRDARNQQWIPARL